MPKPEVVYHNEVSQPTEIQKGACKSNFPSARAKVHARQVDPSVDNMLAITNDGRKLGLDQRVINPLLPDEPGTKVNRCVDNVFKIWEDTKARPPDTNYCSATFRLPAKVSAFTTTLRKSSSLAVCLRTR